MSVRARSSSTVWIVGAGWLRFGGVRWCPADGTTRPPSADSAAGA